MRRSVAGGLVLAALGVGRAAPPPVVLVPTFSLTVKDDVTPPIDVQRRYFKWKPKSFGTPPENTIVPPARGSDGDPTPAGTTGGATLTVYNAAGSGEIYTTTLPASGWHDAFGDGYVYASPTGPVFAVFVKDNRLYVKGGKVGWGYTLEAPSQGAIAVRLTLGTGVTWCGVGTPRTPHAQFDRPGYFAAVRSDVAPAACPPLPGP